MTVPLSCPDRFVNQPIGPNEKEIGEMLAAVDAESLDQLIEQVIPHKIRRHGHLDLPPPKTACELVEYLHARATENELWRSFLGMGYSDCITPPVVQHNVLENPDWYLQNTPYHAEVPHGRLEALLNFQTMAADLTGLEIANALLSDEATAAAEAVHAMQSSREGGDGAILFVAQACHPQTIDVVRTRAAAQGIEVVVGDERSFNFSRKPFGVLLQYPATDGALKSPDAVIERAHYVGADVTMACDLLALTVLVPPGELGADIAVGSAQRFGMPLGYGGPHAAFLACRPTRACKLRGQVIGEGVDALGRAALRMAPQTREEHIRQENETTRVCSAHALPAVVAGMYAIYHGPRGIRAIAERVHSIAAVLANGLRRLGVRVVHDRFFDTVRVEAEPARIRSWLVEARVRKMNLRRFGERSICVALDEATSPADVEALLAVFNDGRLAPFTCAELDDTSPALGRLERKTPYLTHAVFNAHQSETKMLRYVRALESRDLPLVHSMIPLGSCTSTLKATVEMMSTTWTGFTRIHPFAPTEQAIGYQTILRQLEAMLGEITGFPAVSLQPNSGGQDAFAGLLVIKKHHQSRGEAQRDVCLIPSNAHGTNAASAAMAGMRVVVVACNERGHIDLVDLEAKAKEHAPRLASVVVTTPSTSGVFEEEIERICALVHAHGGQVYLDGANLSAQAGLCRPADVGADVCHLKLQKTSCIPHGGGGPAMGPIAVAAHLAKFLPRHSVVAIGDEQGAGAVSAAPWGSARILLFWWAYIALMGSDGLRRASQVAILNANYVATRLHKHFPVLYLGKVGRVARECTVDTRAMKRTSDIQMDDIAKRPMDCGLHAPTVSFPVAGTLTIEPTESESKAGLDRFCDAMIAIRAEIAAIEGGGDVTR